MSAPDSEPQWNLLPDDPQGFMGLEDGFDRKQLKRRYASLIKKYKPDKYPAEFMKIRAAYEELDNELRYGVSHTINLPPVPGTPPDIQPPRQPVPRPLTGAPEVRQPGEPQAPSGVEPTPILSSIADPDPAKVYAKLEGEKQKTPDHYVALAILSDVAKAKMGFSDWLIAGLDNHPMEPAIVNLFSEYCRTSVGDDELKPLLRAASAVLPPNLFFAFTEKLWDRLLALLPFEEFKVHLSGCEKALGGARGDTWVVFYLHMARRALFKADTEWLDEKIEFLEELHDRIPPMLEWDMLVLDVFMPYRKRRERTRSKHELMGKIDAVIRSYCESDSHISDREFLQLQLDIASAPAELLRAIPFDKRAWNWLTDPYVCIADEVSERIREDHEQLGDTRARDRVNDLMMKLEVTTNRTSIGKLWNWSTGCLALLMIGVVALAPYFLIHSLIPEGLAWWDTWDTVLFFVLLFAGPILYKRYLHDYTGQRILTRIAVWFARRIYRKKWRRDLLEFMVRTGLPLDRIEWYAESVSHEDIEVSPWLVAFANRDPAPLLLGIAVGYAH